MDIDVSAVTSHFPNPQDGFTTTTSGSVSSGATTVGLSSTGNYDNGDIVVFIIDPTDSNKKQVFTGTIDVSGSQVTGVVWIGGTNQTHSSGATIVDYYDAGHVKMTTKGILTHSDQDGTLKNGAVDNAAVLASNVVTTAKILDENVTTSKLADNAVSADKLATSAITLGSVSITSNSTTTSSTAAAPSVPISKAVTIPDGGREVLVEFTADSIQNTTANKYCQITLWEGTVGSGTQIGRATAQSVGASQSIPCYVRSKPGYTPSAGSKTYNVGLSTAGDTGTATIVAGADFEASLTIRAV